MPPIARVIRIPEKRLAMEHSIHAASHFYGQRVSRASDRSSVNFPHRRFGGVISFGQPLKWPLYDAELMEICDRYWLPRTNMM